MGREELRATSGASHGQLWELEVKGQTQTSCSDLLALSQALPCPHMWSPPHKTRMWAGQPLLPLPQQLLSGAKDETAIRSILYQRPVSLLCDLGPVPCHLQDSFPIFPVQTMW